MIITLRHKTTQEIITISTDSSDADEPVTFTTDGNHKDMLMHELSESYGHYGHGIDLEETTNLDLQAAAYKLPTFEVVSIAPVITPNQLPEGAVS